jgi:hypothetical protein
MLINKLRDYYGFPDKEQIDYISRATQGMSDELQDDIAAKIIEARPKARGFPDISYLAKFLNDSKGKRKISSYWAVCDDCKSEYDYRFIKCPVCFKAGRSNSGYKVRISDQGIPAKVIRWNQTTLQDDGKREYCVSCDEAARKFCLKFGDPDKQCSAQDFEYCECKKCCAFHKKLNAKTAKDK